MWAAKLDLTCKRAGGRSWGLFECRNFKKKEKNVKLKDERLDDVRVMRLLHVVCLRLINKCCDKRACRLSFWIAAHTRSTNVVVHDAMMVKGSDMIYLDATLRCGQDLNGGKNHTWSVEQFINQRLWLKKKQKTTILNFPTRAALDEVKQRTKSSVWQHEASLHS